MTRRPARRSSGYWPEGAVDPRLLVSRPCRFWPDLFTTNDRVSQAVAKMSCNGCPQCESCLRFGLDLDDTVDAVGMGHGLYGIDGVYGGMTRTERLKLRRQSA